MAISINKFQQDIVEGKNLKYLLNEAYAIAIKIKDKKMTEWCHYELSGYPDNDSVPKYRKIPVRFVADGQFRRNIPVAMPEDYQFLNYHFVTNPVSSLIKLTQGHENIENKVVSFEFTAKLNKELCEMYNQPLDFTFKQVASISQLTDIESEVRERIINWGMQLKEDSKKDTIDTNRIPQTIIYQVIFKIINFNREIATQNKKEVVLKIL